jgi:hypothetical protein
MESVKQKSGKATGESSDKAQEKARARKERNEAQAIEESAAWNVIRAKAQQVAHIPKPHIKYTDTLGAEICTRIAMGESLVHICATSDHIPHVATIYRWIAETPEFCDIYTRAREMAAHTLFAECIDIADDDSRDITESGEVNHAAIARAKLRVDTRLRMAGKLAPKVYAERLANETPQVTVNHNTLNVSARDLSLEQRDSLRQLLLAAKHDDS